MKSPSISFSLLTRALLFAGIVLMINACDKKQAETPNKDATAAEKPAADETIWHVKAISPEGRILDVKALDKDGNICDGKAVPRNGDYHLMDIKAIKDGKKLPVKMLLSHDANIPVKAIGE